MEVAMDKNTVLLFTRFGLGHAPEDLQKTLVTKFLALTLDSGQLPGKMLFYTDGVRLACPGSPVIDLLKQYEAHGVELVLCKTCLDTFGLTAQVQVGVVGGMGDIIEAMQKAGQVISL
jgi:sulfur relay (sulfurtransferase) complex TusBCD TusD component (DsrE family)